MSVIDDYLKGIETAKRRELERIRTLAREIVPDAEETIAYRMPTLKHEGKPFLGFDAHTNHIGLYPYSGKTIAALGDALERYETSRGAIRVPIDEPIPKTLLRKLIRGRLAEIQAKCGRGK